MVYGVAISPAQLALSYLTIYAAGTLERVPTLSVFYSLMYNACI